ncbi:MAG TPA: HD-GYP domain-containing protein [Ideonella sp.]|uniref:HD-GYP domain-containing protein n=1 Tax=Ideonella sp. TaxID=1929293 RepID=UPI002E3588E3|nr:HD-GYP domain-containing protein [Ideonella sp.]HEX5683042.1 HD-GYP domain-containing protein [Ideonella sp.]
MLKKIPVDQVRVGMHLHALDGPWIDHPFWKTSFVIRDPADVAKLRTSGVAGVWIDIGKGLDVAPEGAASAAQPPAAPVAAPASPPQPAAPPLPTSSGGPSRSAVTWPPVPSRTLQDELKQAAALCRQAHAQVKSMFTEARLGRAADAEQCLPLVNDIADSVFRNPAALVSLARLKTQDDYTYLHSVAVCALMITLGRELGLSPAACRDVGLAGLMHDLGKAAMPLDILNKPGKLTDAEYTLMKTHPLRGHELLVEGRGAPETALDVCLNHHERMDGAGYPNGLPPERISQFARMGAVCDVYDAITSDRPYKTGWDPASSIAAMASWKGHFDPVVFKAFVKGVGIYPVGSLVKLQSGRLGVVIEQNLQSLAAPRIKVFFSTKSNMPVSLQELDLARSNDKIVSREDPKAWGFPQLDELWAGELAPKRG